MQTPPFRPQHRLATALLAATLLVACGDDAIVGTSGTVTLRAEQGVEFIDGTFQAVGNYRDSDMIARRSGSNLMLVTGGPNPTVYRPINWFMGDGGLLRRFGSLAEVPKNAPPESMTQPNVLAREGHGFVALTSRGTWTRGFITAAAEGSVTIAFEHLADPILPD
jgi:hypothetical protein